MAGRSMGHLQGLLLPSLLLSYLLVPSAALGALPTTLSIQVEGGGEVEVREEEDVPKKLIKGLNGLSRLGLTLQEEPITPCTSISLPVQQLEGVTGCHSGG